MPQTRLLSLQKVQSLKRPRALSSKRTGHVSLPGFTGVQPPLTSPSANSSRTSKCRSGLLPEPKPIDQHSRQAFQKDDGMLKIAISERLENAILLAVAVLTAIALDTASAVISPEELSPSATASSLQPRRA